MYLQMIRHLWPKALLELWSKAFEDTSKGQKDFKPGKTMPIFSYHFFDGSRAKEYSSAKIIHDWIRVTRWANCCSPLSNYMLFGGIRPSVSLKGGNSRSLVVLRASPYNLVEFEHLFLSRSERFYFKAVISIEPQKETFSFEDFFRTTVVFKISPELQ